MPTRRGWFTPPALALIVAAVIPLGAEIRATDSKPGDPRGSEGEGSAPRPTPGTPLTPTRSTSTSGGVSLQIDLSSLGSIFGPKPKMPSVAVVAKNACSERLWLALADGPICPKVRGWATSALFGASPARSRPGYPTRSFCRYETSGTPSHRAVAALRKESKLHALVPRCGVVQAIATADPPSAPAEGTAKLDEIQSSKLARDFLYEVGDTDLPLEPTGAPNVRLTVLDTVATAEGAPDSLPAGCIDHGFGIAHIARELSCGDRGCAASLSTQLALPLPEAGSPREMAGKTACGGYGTPGDLAVALRAAVDGWLDRKAQTGITARREHLILNLSLGWDPRVLHEQLGAIDPEDHLNAEELAVYDALAYAAERGALAISAAGNLIGGKMPEFGPTLPAGWDAKPPAFPLLPPSEERVVWAVGGIARGGHRLANARPGAEPSLVTYGDHAVVKLAPGRFTKPLTGTSVAAAVASSVAALVWHLRPELAGREVMALLAGSGSPLDRAAESYRASTADAESALPPPVRRLDLSAALGAALAPKDGGAEASPSLGCRLVEVPAAQIPAGCAQRTYFTCGGAPPVCAGDTLDSISATGLVSPKPENNPCPSCSLGGGGGGMMALQIEIEPNWKQGCLTDPMLEVEAVNGERIGISIPLAGKQLCHGDRLRIADLELPQSIGSAKISFRIAERDLSVESPVFVLKTASR